MEAEYPAQQAPSGLGIIEKAEPEVQSTHVSPSNEPGKETDDKTPTPNPAPLPHTHRDPTYLQAQTE